MFGFLDVDIDDTLSMELTSVVDPSKEQVYGDITIPDYGNIDFVMEIEDEKLKMSIPILSDDVLIYDGTEETSGYLADMVDEETLKELDEQLLTLADAETTDEELAERVFKIITDEYKTMDVKKAEKESFEVDGKERKCKGYTVVITEENIENIFKGIENVYEVYGIMNAEMEDNLDVIYDAIEDIDDTEITFYIYKNKLAAINTEIDDEELEAHFLGGTRRMQNIEVLVDGEKVTEIKGTVDGSTEKTRLYFDGEKVATVKYNSKTGELEMVGSPEFEFEFSGVIKNGKDSFVLEVNNFDYPEMDLQMDGKLTITNDAEYKKLSGDEFNLKTASELDWMEMVGNALSELGLY